MTDFKNKSCLVFDTGGGLFHAERLAKDFGKVWAFTPWADGSPKYENFCEGMGMAGVEKVMGPWEYVDKADLICFLDVGWGDQVEFLRSHGYTVFGAGAGEKFEQDRFAMRALQKEIGLPTQETAQVDGVKGLRKYLKSHPDRYVKLNVFRGVVESWYAKDYESAEMILDEIESGFGPHKDAYKFLVEAPVDGIEIGLDAFFNGREFLRPVMWGIESGRPYIGQVTDSPPQVLEDYMERITPTLRKMNYRGPISNEMRVVSDKKAYLVDLTCRFPYPLSCVYTEAIKNYTEVIWAVAKGEDIKIEARSEYVGCLPLTSPHAKDNWLYLDFPEKLSHRIKLNTPTKVGDKWYAVKGSDPVYNLVALGKSIKDIIKQFRELLPQVNAFDLDKDPMDRVYKIKDQFRELKKLGVNFTTQEDLK